MDTKNTDKTELRSEKVSKLTGEIPPSLVRTGIAIIVIVFTALLGASCHTRTLTASQYCITSSDKTYK